MRVDKGCYNGCSNIPILEGIRGIVSITVRLKGIDRGIEERDFSVMTEHGIPVEVESYDMSVSIGRCRDHGRENSLDKIITEVRRNATIDRDSTKKSIVDVGMDSILVSRRKRALRFD
jgi:hypothetical protein